MCDQDEEVEIQRGRGADDIRISPTAAESARIERVAGESEHDKGEHGKGVRRRETFEGEEESREAREHGGGQKPGGPFWKMLSAEPAADDGKTGADPGETDQDVDESEDGETHRPLGIATLAF